MLTFLRTRASVQCCLESSLALKGRSRRSNYRLRFSPVRLPLGMCLVLLLLMAISHASIGHPVTGDADHCALCIAAHSLVPIGLLAVAEALSSLDDPLPQLMEVSAASRYWHPAFFTRPPPTCS
jgi:hypothetical protein